jgi:aryl-alcohol dehydrogenase-like predicted oxidoreductase
VQAAPTEEKEAISLLRQAAEMGYTFYDTAEIDGTPENGAYRSVFPASA